MANEADSFSQWLPVIGKTLALLALHHVGLDKKGIADQAQFLESLGIPRVNAAEMLGTTARSITELYRQRKQRTKAGGSRGKAKPSKRR